MGGSMSSIIVSGDTSGAITISSPAVAGTNTITLPANTGNMVVDNATQTLTNKSIVATQLTGTIAAARLPAGSVLQVIQTVKTDTFTTSSSSYVDVTGLSVTITPTSSSNKILVLFDSALSTIAGNYSCGMQLVRGSTAIYLGDAAGVRTRGSVMFWSEGAGGYSIDSVSGTFLDSPATTSATTYKLQALSPYSQALYINRNQNDSDNIVYFRVPSQITVMEIAA
jgi:hypothetical protein